MQSGKFMVLGYAKPRSSDRRPRRREDLPRLRACGRNSGGSSGSGVGRPLRDASAVGGTGTDPATSLMLRKRKGRWGAGRALRASLLEARLRGSSPPPPAPPPAPPRRCRLPPGLAAVASRPAARRRDRAGPYLLARRGSRRAAQVIAATVAPARTVTSSHSVVAVPMRRPRRASTS